MTKFIIVTLILIGWIITSGFFQALFDRLLGIKITGKPLARSLHIAITELAGILTLALWIVLYLWYQAG